jgi:polyisoprenoid-binding protein YceI
VRFELSPASRVFIDLRASGLLRAVGHDPTLSVALPSLGVDLSDAAVVGGPASRVDVPIEVRIPVGAIEPPDDLSAGDRIQMRDNLRGPEVLDAARWTTVSFRGRYAGSLSRGSLAGDVVVRGESRPLVFDVTVSREGAAFVAAGVWQGTLTELGIKPFKALLGALKLRDWIRVRLQVRWVPA